MFLLSSWFILSVLAGLVSNAFNFINRFLLRTGDDSTAYAWYLELIRVLFFGMLAIFDWHIIITPYSLFLFIGLGLTEFIGTYWYMKMHVYSDLSISSILSRTRMIWVPVLAFFLISEQLHLFDYIGILVLFLGISLTIVPQKLMFDKGVLYANLSAFIIAINIIFIKLLLPYGSNSVILVALALPSVILFPIFMKNEKTRITTLFKTNILLKTISIGLSIAAIYLFTVAVRVGDASKVNAVYQGMMIFAVIAGIIFLKERDHIVQKLIGATVTIIGVVLLGFS